MSTFISAGAGASRRGKPKSVQFTIDTEGNTVTHDRVLFHRTHAGYVCVALGPPARFLRFAFEDEGKEPFFGACRRYARALETGELMPTQVPGGPFSLAKFDDPPLRRLAIAAALIKAGFDPDQPRDDHGRWSHEGAHGRDDFVTPLFFQPPESPPAPVRPPAPTSAPNESLLETTSRLALRGLSLLLRRLSGPAAFFGTILIPSNRSLIQEGALPDHPDLSYRYDEGEGRLTIFRTDADGRHVVYSERSFDPDGIFRDADGHAIGRIVDGGIVIDVDLLPASNFKADTENPRPKLCPDPGPDQPGGEKGIAYQQYIGRLNNGFALPPGLAMNLPNPETGKIVHFDDCRWSDGTMLEAKGPGYRDMLEKGSEDFPWKGAEERAIRQAWSQLAAAGGRPIEWYFAEEEVYFHFAELFDRWDIPITVKYEPMPK